MVENVELMGWYGMGRLRDRKEGRWSDRHWERRCSDSATEGLGRFTEGMKVGRSE